jgi:hypothetical protein
LPSLILLNKLIYIHIIEKKRKILNKLKRKIRNKFIKKTMKLLK